GRSGLATAAPAEYEAESSRFSQTEQGQFVRISELFSDGPAQTAPDRDVAGPAGLVIDDDIIPASVVWSVKARSTSAPGRRRDVSVIGATDRLVASCRAHDPSP